MSSLPLPSNRWSDLFVISGSLIAGIAFLYLSSTYLDLTQQLLISWGFVVLLVLLKQLNCSRTLNGRTLFIIVVTFVTLRYWFWRTTDTLVYVGIFDFIAMVLVYLAELEVLFVHLVSMFVNISPLTRTPAKLPKDRAAWPTVDVFIPTYNEPEDIVRITAIASTQIDYPADKLHVHILDDGGSTARRSDPVTGAQARQRSNSLRRIAQRLNVNYINRPDNEHAKAGNLNYALKQTHGDVILFLDCDHVPTRDILRNTIGFFLNDEKLFLVQTPHFFMNPDPISKNLEAFHYAPGENEMFYRAGQCGSDLWNAAFFCGSGALLRRKYLEDIGGIQTNTVTEDAETALALHAQGYNSVYLARPMVCGLSPETFADFITQRARWCQGMLQILQIRNPALLKSLTLAQRVCYLNHSIFWFFGAARFIFFIAPTLFLLFGLQVYHASLPQIAAYALPYLIASYLATNFFFGKFRWPFFSQIYETIQSIFLIPAIVKVIANPTAAIFKVTPKGKGLKSDFLSPLAFPFYLLFCILLISVPVAVYKWIEFPIYRDVIFICGVWATFNLFVALAVLGAFWEKRQIRRQHRIWADAPVEIQVPHSKTTINGRLVDVSVDGIGWSISSGDALRVTEIIEVRATDSYQERYRFRARIVRIAHHDEQIYCGCELLLDDETSYQQAVRFVYGDSQRWVDYWNREIEPLGLLPTFRHLLIQGVHGGLQGGRAALILLGQLAHYLFKRSPAGAIYKL